MIFQAPPLQHLQLTLCYKLKKKKKELFYGSLEVQVTTEFKKEKIIYSSTLILHLHEVKLKYLTLQQRE